MGIEIVPVTKDNVEQAIALACTVFKPNDHYAIRQEFMAAAGLEPENSEVRDEMEIYRSGYVLAMINGVAAGFSGYYTQEGHEEDIWLGWTGVSSDFGRMGIGEAVINAAFDAAKFDGVKNLRIWTSEEEQFACARRLYARMGFTEENYRADAKPTEGASLARVFTKAADPAKAEADHWSENPYRLPDLELFDMARLDKVAQENQKKLAKLAFAA